MAEAEIGLLLVSDLSSALSELAEAAVSASNSSVFFGAGALCDIDGVGAETGQTARVLPRLVLRFSAALKPLPLTLFVSHEVEFPRAFA